MVSTIYFCLTPFSTLHLKEMAFWPFRNSDVIISHVTTKLGVATKVNEIYFSPNLDNAGSRNEVT